MASPNEAGGTMEDVDETEPASTEPTNIVPEQASQSEVSDDDSSDVAYAVQSQHKRKEWSSEESEAH